MSFGLSSDGATEAFEAPVFIQLPETQVIQLEDRSHDASLTFNLPPSMMAESLEMSIVYDILLEVKVSSRFFSSHAEL
jgi:hypothetical protein